MHRLGFAVEDIPLLIRRLKNQSAVIPRSVFSHFVGSDSPQFDAFTRRQIELFEKGSQELQAAFSHKILRHICNTAGIERFHDAQFDMVRLGIGLYGVSPIDNSIIHNVSTLKTTILQIRDVPQEDTVGYSRMGHLARPSRIAYHSYRLCGWIEPPFGTRQRLLPGERKESSLCREYLYGRLHDRCDGY